MSLRPFCRELRKIGFVFDGRSSFGGVSLTEFHHHQGNRILRVQLWGDGKHRVCHSAIKGRCERERTPPTIFTTIGEMHLAIAYERVRPSTKAPQR